jgi:very-short-patch-repair endonuclease
MDDSLLDLAERQHSTFCRAQARALGVSRTQLERRRKRCQIEQITTQVFRIRGAPVTERSTVMATVLSGGPDALASGTTALALHGVRDFALLPATVVVGRRPPRSAMDGVRESFRVLESHRTIVDGIPTVTAARALFDLAGTYPLPPVARAVDAALAARVTTFDALSTTLVELAESGRPGITTMRALISEREQGYTAPESALEARFLELVRRRGIAEPERQMRIATDRGWVGTVDFAWPHRRIIVETDGRAFHDSITDRRVDERRDTELERAGWIVLRFGWHDVVHRPTSVIRTLRSALRSAA